jgi:predicted dehydrogenase
MAEPLRVGILGFGWMGQVHARAYARLSQHFPDAPLRPELVAVADTATDDRLRTAAEAYGSGVLLSDWRALVARDDVDVVSVTSPNFLHRDMGVAVAESGKHLWIEKPAGRTAEETREIRDAVRAAGVQSAAGFNYRNAPAVELARELIADGRIGVVEHVSIRLLADYSARPDGVLSWRFQQHLSGSGVLGDLVSHGVDLARHLVGELTEVMADRATFIAERPAVVGATHYGQAGGGDLAPVENEDYVCALLRFADGARGILESSRVAVGEQCTYGVEVHGTTGALAWDFRRMGELRLCVDQDYQDASYATRYVTPGDGDLLAFQPGAGIAMGYDDLKVIEARRLVESIATGSPVGATIEDAYRAAVLVDALAESADEGRWVGVADR